MFGGAPFRKRDFVNEGQATSESPRLDADFFNELQDAVIETQRTTIGAMHLTLNANYPLVSSGNSNRVTIPFNVILYGRAFGDSVSRYSDGVIKVEKDGILDINVTLTLNPSSSDSQMLAGYHIYKNGESITSIYNDPVLGRYTPISFGCVIPVGAGDLISVRCSPDAAAQFKTSIHKTSNLRCVHHPMNIG